MAHQEYVSCYIDVDVVVAVAVAVVSVAIGESNYMIAVILTLSLLLLWLLLLLPWANNPRVCMPPRHPPSAPAIGLPGRGTIEPTHALRPTETRQDKQRKEKK